MRALLVPFLAVGVAVSGCATKKYVTREVGEVNQKVDNLTTEVEKTQERTKRNEVRIDEVNQQAQAGITEAKGSAQQALTKAEEAERAAKGKLIYTVTLSNDKVTFPLNRAKVSDDAKGMVDEAIAQLKAENRGVFFEIEGHTDATGPGGVQREAGLRPRGRGPRLHPRPARDRPQPDGGHLLRREQARGGQQDAGSTAPRTGGW